MLLVSLTIYDGCEWTHTDATMEFKNKKELNAYIKKCAAAMDDVKIHSIKRIAKNEK